MKYRLACLWAALLSSALLGCGSKKTEVASNDAAASSGGGMASGPAVRPAPSAPPATGGAPAGSTGQETGEPESGSGASGGPPALEAAGTGGGAAPAGAPAGGGSSEGPPALEAAGAGGGGDAPASSGAAAGAAGGASSGPMLGFGAPGSTGAGTSIGTGVGGGNLLGGNLPGSTGNESESGGTGVGIPGGAFGGLPGSGPQGSSPNLSAAPAIPAVELTLEDRAVLAFQAGNSPRAYALYQAHSLHVPNDEAQSMVDKYRWDKKRIVPRLGYNFAVGLIVKKTPQVKELKPIGTPLSELTSSGQGGPGGGGSAPPGLGFAGGGGGDLGGGGSSAAPAGVRKLPAQELSDAAGNYAAAFVEAFNKLHSEGKWSEAFRDYAHGSMTLPPSLSGLSGLLSGGGAGALGGVGGLGGGLGGAFGGAGALGGPGSPMTGGGPPAGYAGGGPGGPPAGYGGGGPGGAGGPPAGYGGGGPGGPPAGYGGGGGGGPGGPPAGYNGGGSGGPPAGYGGGGGGGPGGPPAGYNGGGSGGPPAGYGGGGGAGPGGPPAGYNGGGTGGPPAGYGGGAPAGGPAAGSNPGTKFLPAPQVGLGAAGGGGPGAGAMGLRGGAPGSPGPGAGPAGPGGGAGLDLGAPGGGFAGFGQEPGAGGGSNPLGSSLSNLQSMVKNFDPKDLQLPSGSIALGAGLVYIGSSDTLADLTKRANEGHYDALIVFEVDASMVIANRSIKNDCRIRAINLKAKEAKDKAFTSTSLNNREVALDKNSETKIENAVNGFMQKLQEAYMLEDLPNIPAESVKKKRLPALAADTSRTVLDRLAEVQLYFSKGLIDETIKVDAFGAIAGSDGQVLATGTIDEKLPVLEKLIKRDFE